MALRGRRSPVRFVVASVVLAAAAGVAALNSGGAATDVGNVGPSYVGTTAPTGQKPQSKLWYAEGTWWGALFDTGSRDFHIFRYDANLRLWSDTGVLIDTRSNTYLDALWDGTHLYIASAGTDAANATHAPRLMRFRYVAQTKTWQADAGFPVTIGNGGTEAAVIDEDSTGRVWATFTQGSKVWLTHGTDATNTSWVPRFQLPASGGAAAVDPDDISAIVAYDTNKIGVLWSNQNDETMYWATHVDGTPDTAWTTTVAYQQPKGADDHINLKSVVGDPDGRVFAAVKTSENDGSGVQGSSPLINLLVLRADGQWAVHLVGTVADDMTRAVVLLAPVERKVFVFAAAPCCSGGKIYVKEASLGAISFPPGRGQVAIASEANPRINNPTSTKQPLTAASGGMVMAGDDGTRRYLFTTFLLATPGGDLDPPETTITASPPARSGSTEASFAFTADEPGSTFACRLDGGASVSCSSPTPYAALASGSHTFSVVATDTAGNPDPTPAAYTWSVDDPVQPAFADDFSGRSFPAKGWVVLTGADGTATIDAGAVTAGDPGAQLHSSTQSGSTASIRTTLSEALRSPRIDLDVRFATGGSAEQSYALIKLYDANGSRIVSLARTSGSGDLAIVSKSGPEAAFSGPAVDTAAHVSLVVVVNPDGLDEVQVVVDGVTRFSSAAVDLGSLPVQRLRFGDDSLRRSADFRLDNVAVRP